jgi:hypothetical protein
MTSRGGRWLGLPAGAWRLLAVLWAVAVVAIIVVIRPDDTARPCRVVQPTTYLPELPEASGIAISRRYPGVLWSHNDSGHAAMLFALGTNGAIRARIARDSASCDAWAADVTPIRDRAATQRTAWRISLPFDERSSSSQEEARRCR